MSESTKSAPPDDAATSAPESQPTAPGGQEMPSAPSVRELLAELARLEDATRETGGARRPTWTARTADLAADLAREREIIEELRRRCPGADGRAAGPDVPQGSGTA